MESKTDFMKLACETAFERMGSTSPNPAVGAVIVKNGEVIGIGGTGPYGSDHAEIGAMKDARSRNHDLNGAVIYVSLEPCNHYGKTPPCTEAIIKSGISAVYIPILDPNPLVAGKGVARLREAGVTVEIIEEYSQPASDLLRGFKKLILKGSPFIINKSAMTLDGRIATLTGDSKWISNDYSRCVVHKLRAKVDAVIVGKNTFINDNPSLNVRKNDFSETVLSCLKDEKVSFSGRSNFFLEQLFKRDIVESKSALRVLVGMPEKIPDECNFFKDDNYIIITETERFNRAVKDNSALKKRADNLNIHVSKCGSPSEEIEMINSVLKENGVMNALLEGGGGISGSFLDAGSIDQFMYFITPRIAGNGLSPVCGKGKSQMSESMNLHDISTAFIEGDLLYNGYKDVYNFELM